MKLLNTIKSALCAAALALTACSDEPFVPDHAWNGQVPDEITLALVIPDPVAVSLGNSRDGDESTFSVGQINFLLLDKDKNYLDNVSVKNPETGDGPIELKDNIITVTTKLNPNTKYVQVAVNGGAAADAINDSDDPDYFSKILVKGDQTAKPVFWGKAEIEDVVTAKTMTLVRNTAKFTVKCNLNVNPDASSTASTWPHKFEITRIGIIGLADGATLAPDNFGADGMLPAEACEHDDINYDIPANEEAALAMMKSWPAGATELDLSALMTIYETKAAPYDDSDTDDAHNFIRVIFKGTYFDQNATSIEGWYVGALRIRSQEGTDKQLSDKPEYYTYGNYLPILRHHSYTFSIDQVRAGGWPTLADALKALPDNRVTTDVVDEVDPITDIEATSDYYLGVGADVEAEYNEDPVITITTSYPGLTGRTDWNDLLAFSCTSDWVDHGGITNVTSTELKNGSTVTGYRFDITLPLEDNSSSNTRYATLNVRAGKLKRDISITQKGCPYTRTRTVTVSGYTKAGNSFSPMNYFSWIEGVNYNPDGTVNKTDAYTGDKVQGISAEANRGANRIGLHFPAVPLYQNVTYTISRNANETASIVAGSESFFLDDTNSDCFVVTAIDPNTPKITTGRLRIKANIDGKERNIDYDLFRTGIIHYLDPGKVNETQQTADANKQRSGWYYYELVNVNGTLVLDRDLGAASNRAYAPRVALYKQNSDAIGGYFKVNTTRYVESGGQDKATIARLLNLDAGDNGRFIIASEANVKNFNIDVKTVCSAVITSGRVANNTIYFSKGGYFEGSEFKNDSHAMLWTRTYLGGTQGLAEESDEYGFWYRYFDDLKSSNPENRFSNIRMARGSNGKVPDAGSVWRYMPVRLVWVDKNGNDNINAGGDDNVVTNKLVVYLEENAGWGEAYIYAWNFTSQVQDKWENRHNMSLVPGHTNLYRYELPAPNKDAGMIFSSQSAQTEDIGNIKELYDAGNTVLYYKVNNTEVNEKNKFTLDEEKSGDRDIYNTAPAKEYNDFRIRFFDTSVGTKSMNLSGGKWELKDIELSSSSSTFFVIAKEKSTNTDQSFFSDKGSAYASLDAWMNLVTTTTSNWILEKAGTYDFTIDPATLKIMVHRQYEYDYKIKGSIWGDSNWSYSDKMTSENGKYVIEITTTHQGNFGIQRYNKGTETANGWIFGQSSTIQYDTPMDFVVEGEGSGSNWANLPAGKYEFTLDPVAKTLTIVKKSTPVVEYDYKIKGSLWGNDWTFSDKMTSENGKYVIEITTTQQGSFGIQRYNKGTETENGWIWGASSTIQYGTPMNFTIAGEASGSNWANLPAGKYEFTLDPVAKTLTIVKKSTPDPEPDYVAPEYDYYLKGPILGSWSNTKKMNWTGSVYTLSNIKLSSGDFGIVRAGVNTSSDDQKNWLYSASKTQNTIVVGQAMNVVVENNEKNNGENWNLSAEGRYEVTFNPSSMTLTFKQMSNEDEYYEMHGEPFGDNDWTTISMYNDNGVWKVNHVKISRSGGLGVKLVKNDSQTGWYTAASNSNLRSGEESSAKIGGTNWSFNETGIFNISFDPSRKVLLFTKVNN